MKFYIKNKQIFFTCPDDKFYKGSSVLQVRETFHENYLASIVLPTKQDKEIKCMMRDIY